MNGKLLKGDVEDTDNFVQMSGYTTSPEFWNNMPYVAKDNGRNMLANKLWEVVEEFATYPCWTFGLPRTEEFIVNSKDHILQGIRKRFPLSEAQPDVTIALLKNQAAYYITAKAYSIRVSSTYVFGTYDGQRQ